ncbi:hypothetical protein CERSUDRAFT_111211 [Gelatoporia subvermispora B]|uniref:arginyltransferase n=1 Tax=Ceriporiopsis subvermispora (strain B) TaxID=914234 RepID=M2RP45_CERS8|nr:hypothetical protein CERSUDRAFT_111211 [Gelatoporia subvermispora B]
MDVISPLTPSASTCGYCSPPGERSKEESSIHQAECIPIRLSCESYQRMIDRGWRRSGTFCYKPDMQRTCCPQYTIKLDALDFKPSRSQRQLVNRWNRFVLYGDNDAANHEGQISSKKGKAPKVSTFELVTSIHASEKSFVMEDVPKHEFEVTLEPASYTDEKFALYQSYQKEIHHEQEKTPGGFKRFLVETPLISSPITYSGDPPDHLPATYGSYHQMYRLDGQLIAMAVLDILPNCVSSVYFMYEKTWERFSLGKLSALREAALVREIQEAGATEMTALYMGYYIHTCQKMRYKGDYSPSFLLDPEEYNWHPLKSCRAILDQYKYASFEHPERSQVDPIPANAHVPETPDDVLNNLKLLQRTREGYVALQLPLSPEWKRPSARRAVLITANGLGYELACEVLFFLAYEL